MVLSLFGVGTPSVCSFQKGNQREAVSPRHFGGSNLKKATPKWKARPETTIHGPARSLAPAAPLRCGSALAAPRVALEALPSSCDVSSVGAGWAGVYFAFRQALAGRASIRRSPGSRVGFMLTLFCVFLCFLLF